MIEKAALEEECRLKDSQILELEEELRRVQGRLRNVGLVHHILHHMKIAMQSKINNKELTWERIYMYLNLEHFSDTFNECHAAP